MWINYKLYLSHKRANYNHSHLSYYFMLNFRASYSAANPDNLPTVLVNIF